MSRGTSSLVQAVVRRSTAARFHLESLWLRLLPHLAKDYFWAEIDGFRLFGGAGNQRFLSRLRRGPVEPFTVHLFCRLMRPGIRVVDIGANLGYYTLLALRRVGSSGTVHAFECDPTNFRFLRHNLRLNRYPGRVVPSPAAVSDEVGISPFFVHEGALGQGSLWDQSRATSEVQVPCTTLDDVLAGEPIDVLKMDIEGGELHALEGMPRTIAASPKLVMFVECNPRKLSAAGATVSMLLKRLDDFGFEVTEIRENERALRPVGRDLIDAEHSPDKRFSLNLHCTRP